MLPLKGLAFLPRLQRFYFCKSFAEFEVRALAMASIVLAGKLQEQPRKVPEVLQVFYKLKMRESEAYAATATPIMDVKQKESGRLSRV